MSNKRYPSISPMSPFTDGYETDDEASFCASAPTLQESFKRLFYEHTPPEPQLQPLRNLPSPPLMSLSSPISDVQDTPNYTNSISLSPYQEPIDLELSPGGTLRRANHAENDIDDNSTPLRTPFHPTFSKTQPETLHESPFIHRPFKPSKQLQRLASTPAPSGERGWRAGEASPCVSSTLHTTLFSFLESPLPPLSQDERHTTASRIPQIFCIQEDIAATHHDKEHDFSRSFPGFLRGLPTFRLPTSPFDERPLSPLSPRICSPLKSPFLIRDRDGGTSEYFTGVVACSSR